MTRRVHLTGQIKPSTREAMLDQLAAIADGIIRQREQERWLRTFNSRLIAIIAEKNARRWWHRFAWWRK